MASGRDRPRTSRTIRRRRLSAVLAVAGIATLGVSLARGGSPVAKPIERARFHAPSRSASATATSDTRAPRARRQPRTAHLRVSASSSAPADWTTVAWVDGQPAASLEQSSGVTLMRFDQGLVHLTLHAGSSDGGVSGWTYGDQITPREIHLVVAAFNGGFKLTYTDVGFASGGHTAVALKPGLASIVTYTDGTSNIGTWGNGVPSRRKPVFSVLQNQRLLVDRGVAAATVTSCILACWGATIAHLTVVARSALGITAAGQLLWAAGEQLTPATLAAALVSAGAVRAIELDINPDWVDGYLYVHHPTGPVAAPLVPGQRGIAGEFLAPYSRDFLVVVAN